MTHKSPPEGERRKQPFVALNEAIDEIKREFDDYVEASNRRLRRFFIGMMVAFAVIGLSSAIGLAGFAFVLSKQDEVQANVARQIQKQRYDSLVESCLSANQRHTDAIQVAEERFRAGIVPKVGLETIRFIVDKLEPFTVDCTKNAKERVKEVTK